MSQIETLYAFGFALIIIGTAVIIITTLLQILRRSKAKSETKAGGIILIGPIPIVFGTDKETVRKILWLALTLSIIVLAILVVIYFLQVRT